MTLFALSSASTSLSRLINFSFSFSSNTSYLKLLIFYSKVLPSLKTAFLCCFNSSNSVLNFYSISLTLNSLETDFIFILLLNYFNKFYTYLSSSSSFYIVPSTSTSIDICSYLSTIANGSGLFVFSFIGGSRVSCILLFCRNLFPTLENCDWNISD